MAKYSGYIGYSISREIAEGVWIDDNVDRLYYGDIVKNRTAIQQGANISPNVSLTNSVSIVADAFAYENFYSMRYVTYLGKKWSITSIDIERPRIVLTLGGVYNG